MMTKQYKDAKELCDHFEEYGFLWTDSGDQHYEMFQYTPMSYYEEDSEEWFEVRIWLNRIEFVQCNHNENNCKAKDDQVLFTTDLIDEVVSIIQSNEDELYT
tara:strand:+ start:660 stop:965 length:306 start_codon:yes stop_codon:yes gene_type:complete